MPTQQQQDTSNEHETKEQDNQHPAGPHARPELTDNEKTPGTGSLADDTDAEGDVGPD